MSTRPEIPEILEALNGYLHYLESLGQNTIEPSSWQPGRMSLAPAHIPAHATISPEKSSITSRPRDTTVGQAAQESGPLPPRQVAAPQEALPQQTPAAPAKTLEQVRAELGDCTRCNLCQTRQKIVFGEGNPTAELLFIGEAPGEEEDRQGRPFVGASGELFTKILGAMNLNRDQVYITNLLKCRPPHNREPQPDEINFCSPFLEDQISSIHPKIICTLGKYASQTVLKRNSSLTTLRGRFYNYRTYEVMPTFHPAFLLRYPEFKRKVWEDMQLIMKKLKSGQQS
jgi:DNA polymerase